MARKRIQLYAEKYSAAVFACKHCGFREHEESNMGQRPCGSCGLPVRPKWHDVYIVEVPQGAIVEMNGGSDESS